MARDRLTARVRIWSTAVPARGADLRRERALLSDDEIERADRFKVDRPRRCFVTARAMLRRLLGAARNRDPRDIVFTYGDRGKPALANDCDPPVTFNLSHSGEHIVAAIARGLELGIDIEVLREIGSALPIAERFFSESESDHLATLDGAALQRAFFHLWTAKEAYLKAIGTGLATPLRSVVLNNHGDGPPRILTIADDAGEARRWRLERIPVADATMCSLAVRDAAPEYVVRRFPRDFDAAGIGP